MVNKLIKIGKGNLGMFDFYLFFILKRYFSKYDETLHLLLDMRLIISLIFKLKRGKVFTMYLFLISIIDSSHTNLLFGKWDMCFVRPFILKDVFLRSDDSGIRSICFIVIMCTCATAIYLFQ